MGMGEGAQCLDLVAGDRRVILNDFFDRATEVVFIDNLLGWYPGTLAQRNAPLFSGNDLDLRAFKPIHTASISIVAARLASFYLSVYSAAMAWRSTQRGATTPRDPMQELRGTSSSSSN